MADQDYEKLRASMEQERLDVERRRATDVARIAKALDRIEVVVTILERVLDVLKEVPSLHDVIQDLNEVLQRRLERIEKAVILRGKKSPHLRKITGELEAEIISETVASLKEQLLIQTKKLNNLNERWAKYGISAPYALETEIEEVKDEIERIRTELDYFKMLDKDE